MCGFLIVQKKNRVFFGLNLKPKISNLYTPLYFDPGVDSDWLNKQTWHINKFRFKVSENFGPEEGLKVLITANKGSLHFKV